MGGEASFSDVPQPGGFRVSAVRWEGRMQAVEVANPRGGTLALDVPDRASMTLRRGQERERVAFPLELHLSAGEAVSLIV